MTYNVFALYCFLYKIVRLFKKWHCQTRICVYVNSFLYYASCHALSSRHRKRYVQQIFLRVCCSTHILVWCCQTKYIIITIYSEWLPGKRNLSVQWGSTSTGPVFYLCFRTWLETVLAKTVRWRCWFSISVLDRRSFFKFKFKFLLTH